MNACAICGQRAPTCGDEHREHEWFHFDPDGVYGDIRPVWFCGTRDEQHSDEAVALAISGALADKCRAGAVRA